MVDFLIEQARGKFIEHVWIVTYLNCRRSWPELGEDVAGGEFEKSKNGILRLGLFRVLIPIWVVWGRFCELVGIGMGVGEWSERENEFDEIRRKIDLRERGYAQIRTIPLEGVD